MNNKIPLALTLCSTMIALPLQANEGPQWRAIAFGQSTDSNFSSNVLPEKIGVNDVTIAGKKLTPQDVADLMRSPQPPRQASPLPGNSSCRDA